MEKQKTSFAYETKPTAKELWKFSMIYAYKGIRAGVNIILVGGSLFIVLTRWETLELFQRLILLFFRRRALLLALEKKGDMWHVMI